MTDLTGAFSSQTDMNISDLRHIFGAAETLAYTVDVNDGAEVSALSFLNDTPVDGPDSAMTQEAPKTDFSFTA